MNLDGTPAGLDNLKRFFVKRLAATFYLVAETEMIDLRHAEIGFKPVETFPLMHHREHLAAPLAEVLEVLGTGLAAVLGIIGVDHVVADKIEEISGGGEAGGIRLDKIAIGLEAPPHYPLTVRFREGPRIDDEVGDAPSGAGDLAIGVGAGVAAAAKLFDKSSAVPQRVVSGY